MKGGVNLFKIAGILLCVLFVIISFLPCVQENETVIYAMIDAQQEYQSQSGFAQGFSAVISVLEIILLLLKRRGFRIVGAVFAILKVALPLTYYHYYSSFWEAISPREADVFRTYSCSLLPLTYVLVLIGAVSVVLYIISFRADKLSFRPAGTTPRTQDLRAAQTQDLRAFDFEIPEK